jgi:hypothetical protein
MLCSCNMKEFLELMDSKVVIDSDGKSDEDQFVSEFISILNEEIPGVIIY